jgi:hypothetical protein
MVEVRQRQIENPGCREFEANLAAYLEGEACPDVSAHAKQCSSCSFILEELESIRAVAKDLPLEAPPPRVWSNIRATLAAEGLFREQKPFWLRWISAASLVPRTAPAAALVFALLLAVIMVFKGDIQRNGSRQPVLTSSAASIVPVGLSGVQTNLVRTVQDMEASYRARESSLDPSAKQVYQAGLTSLNNSIHECLDSLQKQPHNMLVREYLMQAYAQKAEILASALEYGGR